MWGFHPPLSQDSAQKNSFAFAVDTKCGISSVRSARRRIRRNERQSCNRRGRHDILPEDIWQRNKKPDEWNGGFYSPPFRGISARAEGGAVGNRDGMEREDGAVENNIARPTSAFRNMRHRETLPRTRNRVKRCRSVDFSRFPLPTSTHRPAADPLGKEFLFACSCPVTTLSWISASRRALSWVHSGERNIICLSETRRNGSHWTKRRGYQERRVQVQRRRRLQVAEYLLFISNIPIQLNDPIPRSKDDATAAGRQGIAFAASSFLLDDWRSSQAIRDSSSHEWWDSARIRS